MDAALDLGEPLECLERASAGALGKVGRRDELADLAVVAVGVVVGGVDAQVQSADPLALDALDVDLHALDAERGRDAAKRLELGAGVAAAPRGACRRRDRRHSRGRGRGSLAAPGDAGRDRPGAEPVVDADDREPGRARREHRVSAVVPPCAEP